MHSEEGRRLAAALVQRVGNDADAAAIADAIVATWKDIAVALDPVVGRQGVAAIYRRSLLVSARSHPWLRAIDEDVQAAIDLESLKGAIGQQSSAVAVEGGSTFLQTFHDTLSGLIGTSLTGRLLRSVWDQPASDAPPTQDPTP